MNFLEDHIWPLAFCFVAVLVAFTVMSVTGHGGDGTLLRAVILSLGGAVAGYAAGNKTR
jgi:hypothetical protein